MASLDSLVGNILNATTPQEIVNVISAVDLYIRTHFVDPQFYSTAFPILIEKLFGFSHAKGTFASASWIKTASFEPNLADRLFGFLSPDGTLFSSIFAFDDLSLVKPRFSANNLSQWSTSLYLTCSTGNIQQLLKGTEIHDHPIHFPFNFFKYFIFGFAYYPLFITKSEMGNQNDSEFSVIDWLSSIPVISRWNKKGVEQKSYYNLYLRLLHAYLHAFVPISYLNAHHSSLHYRRSCDVLAATMDADFVVKVFLHCWLRYNDVSPLDKHLCNWLGLKFPFRQPRRTFLRLPIGFGLGEVVKSLLNHLNISWATLTILDNQADYYDKFGSSNFPTFPLWSSHTQRSLYRFISTTFLFSPIAPSSMNNISEVFSVWIDYIQPWKLNSKNSIVWDSYVVWNYLFYSSLVMHFIGFAHNFLHTDAQLIVSMVSKVIDILTSSKELMDIIKNVDADFHSVTSKSGTSAQIREKLQDWEDALDETDGHTSSLKENLNHDLRLFNAGKNGGPQLFQHFILRAEDELQSVFGGIPAKNLQYIHSLKSGYQYLFGEHVKSRCPQTPLTIQWLQSCAELFNHDSNGNVKHKSD